MLKKLFAAIVSVAMLFCMSTSAMGVQAENSNLVTIDGEENGTITLYYPEATADLISIQRSFSYDSNVELQYSDLSCEIIGGKGKIEASVSSFYPENKAREYMNKSEN